MRHCHHKRDVDRLGIWKVGAISKRRNPELPGIAVHVRDRPKRMTLLVTESIVLGGEASCALSFDDANVSPRHAEIYRVGDLWWVRDLGSEAGTYVDGDPIDAAPVAGPTVVRLGESGPVLVLEPERIRPQGG